MWKGGMVELPGNVTVRKAVHADMPAIAAVAEATGQDTEAESFPAYLRHLMAHGTLLVAERDGGVAGYGATMRIGAGPMALSMLTAAHGSGLGRAVLAQLWRAERRWMTFSSLHSNALPLYTSFGLDAWWPLLYLSGDVRRLRMPAGWSVAATGPREVAVLERAWTGFDRERDHVMWAARPNGSGVVASQDARPMAAGTVGGRAGSYGISHLAVDVTTARDADARDAVVAVLSWLDPAGGQARVKLPAPHPATRSLLAAGWRVEEFDLHMASEFGLIDPLRLVPSPDLA
jgi:hypothetical protein